MVRLHEHNEIIIIEVCDCIFEVVLYTKMIEQCKHTKLGIVEELVLSRKRSLLIHPTCLSWAANYSLVSPAIAVPAISTWEC